ELSPDGKWLAVVEAEALRVVDLSSGEEAFSLPRPSVRALAFSPRGTYLLTWEKLSEGVAENLRLWRTADGAFVCGWAQKLLGEKWQWPALRWAADESFFARALPRPSPTRPAPASPQVHCFDGAAPSQTVAQRLRVPGVSNFAIAPAGSPPLVATFVPEGKGAPATVRLWRHGDYGEGRFLASKTFFKAGAGRRRGPRPTSAPALLVRTHVDVDTGGKSYDGASGLMHMDASGDASVMRLPKEGPIHDVQWAPKLARAPPPPSQSLLRGVAPSLQAPDSSEFLALFGFSPPRACLFSGGKGHKVLHDFGDDARNTVCWAPHGRSSLPRTSRSFILAGFGNLGGELSFWDRKTLRCLSTVDAHMTVAFEWSPDSRAFLTAVLWPRLRVENGVKLWSPSG
ncbi:hypothetical protein EMIHUDRAFT_52343, partial [Emiliania huxleyi CCMP1516]|uniref:Eukaryotic translation initiation factor 2A n=2 Tax=Emiliania huxleyi TaxID=2903 RepID=A0A0D3KEZ7_EMIH1